MSEHTSLLGPSVADDLDAQLELFIETLSKEGYAEITRQRKVWLIAPFIRWVRKVGIEVRDIDEVCVDTFLADPTRRRYKHRTALRQYLEHLRVVEVVPRRRWESSSAEVLVQKYLEYLRDKQGLSPHSISVYSPFVHDFAVAQQLPEDAAVLGASALREFLIEHSRSRSSSFVKLLATALRSFLRYCFVTGTIAIDLSIAIPPVHRWRFASVPPALTAEEVEQVIAAADPSTARGCRDFAVLLLLARLGLRASEVIAIELDDIRWVAGEIVVRGKGRVHDRLPLLADVGEALALYLSAVRGPSSSRRVFLRLIAPRVGLSQPSAVSKIAGEALLRAELRPTGRVGAHIFRHSLATRMIRRGASLAEISQVLRHRSTSTTQLYAKVDLEGLRGVGLPWPAVEVSR